MIDITLRPLTAANQTDLDRCDSAFLVETQRCLRADRGRISYTVEPVAPFVKSYADRHDSRHYIEQPDHAGWLAYAGDRVAGQILVQEYWNRLAIIRDIAVDPPYRRHGIGHRLIGVAVAWAREREMAGVMLETQNVNVPACRFYESCGFDLGGMDRCLYRGIDPLTHEIATYYYLLFQRRPMTTHPPQLYPEPTVGALIVDPAGRLLLMRSHKWLGAYVIPGGHVELGETLEAALRREVAEETGLEVHDIVFLCVQEFIYDPLFWQPRHFIFFDYACRTKTTDVHLNDEAQAYLWVAADEALSLHVEPYTQVAIRAYLSQRDGLLEGYRAAGSDW